MESPFSNIVRRYQSTFHPVVKTEPGEQMLSLNLTEQNRQLSNEVLADTDRFSGWINQQLEAAGCRYAIGGYGEKRKVYQTPLFAAERPGEEPRTVHLGIDIWGPAGTPVYAFMGGMVHSFAYNALDGDYGATIVLLHQLDGMAFYTLYGHLSLKDIQTLSAGQYIIFGQPIGHFGPPSENGNWPPHLHFQVILDMELKEGDYPGVCRWSEREKYFSNCPDPNLILQLLPS
ncbi:MAG TPA: peptidoglycan DD-metalloendopeptidase family protein [Pseudobacter sp.]|nr:peptidoglycan DD-metalloendopeptidase family protein [Pseudobacter sp.]